MLAKGISGVKSFNQGITAASVKNMKFRPMGGAPKGTVKPANFAGNGEGFGGMMSAVGASAGKFLGDHEQVMKRFGSSVATGAMYGAGGGLSYNIGELATGGQGFQSKGIVAGAWQGAKYGMMHGALGVPGGIAKKGNFTGKWQGIATAGRMSRNAQGHWSTNGALRIASFAGAGNTSLTKPVNSNRY